MKRISLIATLAVGLFVLGGHEARARVPQDADYNATHQNTEGQKAKDNAKEAGRDTKDAAKSTGRAVKHGTKKTVNEGAKGVDKAADKTHEGAQKVQRKTGGVDAER
jgi:hypothetical protein